VGGLLVNPACSLVKNCPFGPIKLLDTLDLTAKVKVVPSSVGADADHITELASVLVAVPSNPI